ARRQRHAARLSGSVGRALARGLRRARRLQRRARPSRAARHVGWEQKRLAARDHLRWNSGAISNKVKAWGLVSALAMARRVSAEASGPRAVSATASGSRPGPTR